MPISHTSERLHLIVAALDYLRAMTHKPRLEVQQLQMLLTLYQHPEGLNMGELAAEMKVDHSFVSRNAKAFGSAAQGRRMVGMRIDDENPRYRIIFLTSEGRGIIDKWIAIGAGVAPVPKLAPVRDTRYQG